MNREEVKQVLREKKIKKALRCYRGRFLKNLFIWLVGMITCVALLAGGVFVGVKLVPIKTFTGSHTEEYVSEDVGNLSVFDAIMGIKSYGVSDFPIIEKTLSDLLTSSGAGNYISIDFDKLRTVKFTYSEPGKTLVSELQSCVTVTASINSIGGVSMLGDIGNLSVFSEYEEVTEAVDPTAEGFNAKLYYYKTEVDGTDVYKRAFTDEGAYVDGVTSETTLYYPNLADIPLIEAKDVLTASFSRLKALDMLETMGANVTDDIIVNLLGDKTIKELGSLNQDTILLTDFIPGPDTDHPDRNRALYDMVRQASDCDNNDEITLRKLTQMDIKRVYLSNVLGTPDSENKDLYDLLVDATGKTWDNIRLEDLTNNPDLIRDLKLTTVLKDEDEYGNPLNEKLYAVLRDLTDCEFNEDITVGMLATGLDLNDVKLTVILPDEDEYGNPLNEKLYNILRSATISDSNDAITLGALSAGINIDNVSLTAVLPYDSGTEQLYGIIQDMTGLSYADVTVSSLTSFDVSLIKLGTVFAESSNQNLYKLLADAVTLGSGETSVADITLGSLNSRLNIQNIRLGTILDGVTVTNRVLLSIKEKNVRISELGATLDALTLNEVFGDRSVFSTTVNGAEYYYNEETDTYILASSVGNVLPDGYEDGYYIASDASVWLFMMYQAEEVGGIKHDNDGYALKYTGTGITFGQMSSAMGDVASDMMNSTIRELVIAGMVDGSSFGSSSNIYKYTVQQAMNMLANAMNTYPGFFS